MKQRLIPLILLLVTSYLLAGRQARLLVTDSFAQSTEYIRVAILQDERSISLKIKGAYEITDMDGREILSAGRNLRSTVTTYKEGILIAGKIFKTDKVLIKINDPDVIIINGRTFRGNIQFIKNNSARLTVINYIELEDYIKGILYHETSHYWPMEALKAQAIVCRTYALNACIENKSKDYDATSDIYSQVYGGRTSERFRTNNAVQETRGLVLTYKDKVFSAYYHATCGGHTEDASLLWDIDIVPLKGVPCGFCKDSPHFNWHYVLSIKELEEKLKEAGIKALKINDVIVLGRDKSGRVTDLKVACGAKDIIISAKDLRSAIGPNIIRSTNFTLRIEKQDVVFEGFGWGHGVGLCQWGAYFMAKAGHNYKKILEYYYPQTNVKTTRF